LQTSLLHFASPSQCARSTKYTLQTSCYSPHDPVAPVKLETALLWLHNGYTADMRCVRLSITACGGGLDTGGGARYLLQASSRLPFFLLRPDQNTEKESLVTVLTRTIVQCLSNTVTYPAMETWFDTVTELFI
jgi:hypothetical protein